MSQYKRIFIIGHPGAGKALLAKTLAEKIGWQFIDADLGLEFRIGRTLPEIVGMQGEKAFNDCGYEILYSQLSKENIVVTTDASIVLNEKNKQLLSSEFVVNLKVSTPVQLKRNIHNLMPLLPITDLKEFLDQLHAGRDSLYDQMANLSINSDDDALEEHVLEIINMLEDEDTKLGTNRPTLNEKELIFFHKKLHTPIHLSYQQAICLKLLAQGKSSKEIAREIDISHRTVENYLAKTMELLGCSSSKELITLYFDKP